MIWREILNSRATPALRAAPEAARVMVGAAVAGLAVIVAAAPALAAQHSGGTAASHARAGTTGRHTAAGRMSPGPSWALVAAGSNHTCGIRTGGTLWCWGDNEYGELGTGTHTSQDRPRQVTTPAREGWASVTAGYDYTCAIRTGDTLWCWGYNRDGELGTGNHTSQDRPQQVTTPARGGWVSVTARDIHACAIRTDATLWCWGYNSNGELGTGNHTSQDRPQQVTTPAAGAWTGVTTGSAATCAIRTGGTLWCWGHNGNGELGTGNHTSQDRPQQVTTPAPGGWASLTAGYGHICATRTNSTLWCWGSDDSGQLGTGNGSDQDRPRQVTTPAPGGWASVTAGDTHTCATRTGGTLWCWGSNYEGELGIGTTSSQEPPRQVTTPAPGGWASITAGFLHTCALRTSGTLWCWGDNFYGQLGIGNHTGQDQPRQVTGCAQPGAQLPSRRITRRPAGPGPHPAKHGGGA